MFKNFGKKKDAAPAQEGLPAEQPPAAQPMMPAAGQSLFAREINPPPANIDFFSTAPVFGPAWEPPPLMEELPPGMGDALPPPDGLPPFDPAAPAVGYADPLPPPPELAPYTPPPPAEQLPWEASAALPPPEAPPAWEASPAPMAEPAPWEQPLPEAPAAWEASPAPMAEPAPWEQPLPEAPAAWEASPAPMAEPAPWEQPLPEAPAAWEAPQTEEPPQLAQIYPEDAFQPTPEPAWPSTPDPGLPALVADLYPSDSGLGGPVGETLPMPDLQMPPPVVDDPFAVRFDEPGIETVADPMQGFGPAPDTGIDPFAAPADAGFDFGMATTAPEPAPGLNDYMYTGPAESAEDPFAVEAGVDPFAVETSSLDPFAVEAVGDDIFAPSMEAPGGFGLDAGPALPPPAPEAMQEAFNFDPPILEEVTSGTPALDLWDNLDTGTTPAGAQFPDSPEAPGHFLDSVNSQLYPDDPFAIDTGTLTESAQAFEEASHLLFPETASAPVEWEDSGVGEPDPLLSAPALEAPPLELGPSFQAEAEGISDLTDSYAPPDTLSTYDLSQSGLETTVEPTGYADASAWASPIPAPESPAESSPWEAPDSASTGGLHPYADPLDTLPLAPVSPLHPYAEPEASDPNPSYEINPYADPADLPTLGVQLDSAPDFPTPDLAHPYAEESLSAVAAPDFSDYGAFSPTEPLSNPDLADAFGEEADTVVPTYSLDNVVPLQPAGTPETTPVAPQAQHPASGLEMENLQILGFCALDDSKRLLMVENNGTFALMGQAGEAHNPNISKIKEFNYNPLQYQNTFTAVKEAATEDQGMYIVQVGTWRAIISTVKETILLHTELG